MNDYLKIQPIKKPYVCDAIYRIMVVLKVNTDSIASIAANVI
jgi:hypothetical protein